MKTLTTFRERQIRRMQRLARSLELTTEDLYDAVGGYDVDARGHSLWGDDTQEEFGDLSTVAAQVRMIYAEAELRGLNALAVTESIIRADGL